MKEVSEGNRYLEEKGMARGIEIGQQKILSELCKEGILTPEQAAQKAKMKVEDFLKFL